jgi:hypothetical protein
MSLSRSIVPALAAALALAPAGARADLLVTRDGATVETQGAWRVDGRRVVFTLPDGQLSSLRTDDVDLDRSALATARAAEAAAAPAAAPAAPAEPVLRLTEKDIPPMTETGDEAAPAAAAAAAPSVPLEVLSWDRLPLDSGDGVQIFGTLRNTGNATVIAPALSVSVYGEEGGLLAMTEASVNQTSIAAGKTANFRAELPGLPDFAAARFIPSGRGYEGSSPAVEGEEEANELPDAADATEFQPELEPVPEPQADVEPPPAP